MSRIRTSSSSLHVIAASFASLTLFSNFDGVARAGLELVSTNAAGIHQNGNCVGRVAASDGARFVAFSSNATNLVPSNGITQVYVKDTLTGAVELVSHNSLGEPATAASLVGDITPDGRFVLFETAATNLGFPVTGVGDVYRFDRQTAAIELVSIDASLGAAFGQSSNSTISDDGNLVLFVSTASDLVPGDTNNRPDLFLRDIPAATTTRMNVGPNGQQDIAPSANGSMSADGRFIAFTALLPFLPEDPNNSAGDVYVRDRLLGTLTVASVNLQGTTSPLKTSGGAILGANGLFVAFSSNATDLVPGGSSSQFNVFVRSLATNETAIVSTPSGVTTGANGFNSTESVSPDGRFVLFSSLATNLSLADTNAASPTARDVFVHDTQFGRTAPVDVDADGETTSGNTSAARFSRDGRAIVIINDSIDLFAGDTPGSGDVFVNRNVGFGEAGASLPGTNGKPRLAGEGTLLQGTAAVMTLTNAAANSAALLALAPSYAPTAVDGGIFLPGISPNNGLVAFALVTDSLGGAAISMAVPNGLAPGAITIQCLIADPLAPLGVAFSNGLFAFVR